MLFIWNVGYDMRLNGSKYVFGGKGFMGINESYMLSRIFGSSCT